MWSCDIITVVFLQNRTLCRAVGPAGGVPLTLLASAIPNTLMFNVFGCVVFARIPDKQRKQLDSKPFRGVFMGYPPNPLGYHIYNPTKRRITTSMHVVFQGDVHGFHPTITPLLPHCLTPRRLLPGLHVPTPQPTDIFPPGDCD
jgi:hypothetical protein